MFDFCAALTRDDLDSLTQFFEHTAIPNHRFSEFPPGSSCFGTKPIPALNVALYHNSCRCAEFLIENGADIDQRDGSGHCAAHAAAACGNPALLDLLSQYHCDICAASQNGSEPLHIAAACGRSEAVEWLLEQGADLECRNAFCRTPLLVAAAGNSLGLVQMLVSYGADVGARDDGGNSSVHIALKARRFENARFLMSLGVVPLTAANFDRVTFPMIACQLGDLGLLQYLVKARVNTATLDRRGRSILHYAILYRRLDLVLFILSERLVDPTAEDIFHVSALHLAAASRSAEIVAEIAKYDAIHLNCTKCGFSPLHIALKRGVYDVVEVLCALPGVDWNVENVYGVFFKFSKTLFMLQRDRGQAQ
jgi:ankyrin repeat protein